MSRSNKEIVNKSAVKIAGVKSLLINGDQKIMTSFAAGEKATIEKVITKDNLVTFENSPSVYKVKLQDPLVIVEGMNKVRGEISDPTHNSSKKNKVAIIGETQTKTKKQLENLFYGRIFNDNIHIQLIYNILDINKIISPYINNIIFTINNLKRSNNSEYLDLIGTFYNGNYQDLLRDSDKQSKLNVFKDFIKDSKPYYPYFGDAFVLGKNKPVKNKNENDDKKHESLVIYKDDEQIFLSLRILALIRQSTIHNKLSSIDSVFNENFFKKTRPDVGQYLDNLFKTKIEKTNKSFIDLNQKHNFYILFTLFNIANDKSAQIILGKEFYNYIVRKDEKNLGISVKKLRENILLLEQAIIIHDKKYDTVRSKLYNFFDFIIFNYFNKNKELLAKIVEALRFAKNDEQKDKVYLDNALEVWSKIKDKILNALLPLMDGNKIAKYPSIKISDYELKAMMANDQVSHFSKSMYLMTLFLDGKEINELLSGLINKFMEIDSFNNVIKDQKKLFESTGMKPDFNLFNQAGKIAEELKLVKSISRMTNEDVYEKESFRDAASILGFTRTSNFKTDEEYIDHFFYGKTIDKNMRNFIVNNVISSRRFKYLVRYINPKKVRQTANNRNVFLFVLNKINKEVPAQIERYYTIYFGKNIALPPTDKIKALVDKLTIIKLEDFIKVEQKPRPGTNDAILKEKKKALLGLYLTILYIFYKNIVNINSRYFIALHALERDASLHQLIDNSVNNDFMKTRANGLLELFLNSKYLNHHATKYLTQNNSNYQKDAFNSFRNHIAHLSAVNIVDKYIGELHEIKNYFHVYHFIFQRSLGDTLRVNNDFFTSKFSLVKSNKGYSKDLLHVLCVPFGYNLARYKSLTTSELFDKNEIIE